MKYILCKLLPPRPTFDRDMNEAEKKVMQEHVGYWAGLAKLMQARAKPA